MARFRVRFVATLSAGVVAFTFSAVGAANAKPRHDLSAAEAAAAIERVDGSPVQASKRVKIDGATVGFGSGHMVLEDASGARSQVGGLDVFEGSGVDFALRATEDGAQALSVIANSSAPKTSSYRFPGLFLTQEANGVVAVRKGSVTGEPVGVIDPAWAKDARGAAVPTSYEIVGDRLVQRVAATAASAYPVVADPRVRWAWYGASVDFTKTDTVLMAGGAGAVWAVAARIKTPGVSSAVGATAGLIASWASTAAGLGKCVSIKYTWAMLVPGASVYGTIPWITKCYA